jgi:hypothetical protein
MQEHMYTAHQQGARLTLKSSGMSYFRNGTQYLLHVEPEYGAIRYVIDSDADGALALLVDPNDATSRALLQSLTRREKPDLLARVLASRRGASGPVVEAPTEAVPGNLFCDGSIFTMVAGNQTSHFLLGRDRIPHVTSFESTDAGGIVVVLQTMPTEWCRIHVDAHDVFEATKALAYIRPAAQPATNAVGEQPKVTQSWEYKIVKNMLASSLEEALNSLGASGWEVVSITGMDGVMSWTGNKLYAVLKRPRTRR